MTKFLELTFSGISVGAQYALVALGFVVIYRATGVINFAQGGFVLLGAYLTYNFHQTWGVPFYFALLMAMAAGAVIGLLVEALILRRLVGRPPFILIMVTIGLAIIIDQITPAVWGASPLSLDDPWKLDTVTVGDLNLKVADFWTLGLVAIVLTAFFVFFRYSKQGLAMRATALDQEAALAQGISASRVFALAWAIAGAVAAVAGVTLAAAGGSTGGVAPQIEIVALAAFPAIILGGLDSPVGAVVGALIIGVSQSLTAGYQPEYAPWLGQGFALVMPYFVMLLVLMIRPYGLFGTPEVRRV